jgi:hypothetical protein
MTKKLTDEQIQQIVELHGEGLNCAQIGHKVGVCVTTVSRRLKSVGLIPNYYHRQFTESEISLIIELHAQGLTNTEISKSISRSNSVVGVFLKQIGLVSNKKIGLEICGENGVCRKCSGWKNLSAFYFNKTNNCYSSTCRECTQAYVRKRRATNIDVFMRTLVSSMKQRDIEQEFSHKDLLDILDLQNYSCFYSGVSMVWGSDGKSPHTLSVDKIIPNKGYRKGNVVLCCNWINTMKNNASLETLKIWMPPVYEKIQQGYRDGVLY